MKNLLFIGLITLVMLLAGCGKGADSPKGFSLPKGNEQNGELVFNKYQCLACHTLEGYNDADLDKVFADPIPLGGTSAKVKTYAQLVTSIINPSHELAPRSRALVPVVDDNGQSKMTVFNDVMTVTEMIDVVAFLQPEYKVKPIQYTSYLQYQVP